MPLFTAEAEDTPICTYAADDLEEAEALAELEKDDWVTVGAIPDDVSVSVRQANTGEMTLWIEMRDEAMRQAQAEAMRSARIEEESIVAFHVRAFDLYEDASD